MKRKISVILFISLVVFISGCIQSNETQKLKETISPNETVKDENWELSSTFKTTENRTMIGKENRIGVICSELKSNNPAKCMWHFWDDTLQTKEYTVRLEGIMKENNKKFPLLTPLDGEPTYTQKLGMMGYNNGAPFHRPTRLSFPHSGVWKVSISFNDEYFDSIILDVK